ncbi:MAG: hypothetical protein ACR2RV_26780 [Verrucomicrobiales bacterium]
MRVIMFFLFFVAGLMLTAGYFLSREPRPDELERFTFTKKVPVEELEAKNPYAKVNILRITLTGDRKVSYGDQRPHYETLRDRLKTEAPATISVGRMHGPIASIFESTINRFLPASTDDDIYEVTIKGEQILSYDEALDSKQSRSILALGAGLASLFMSGAIVLLRKAD